MEVWRQVLTEECEHRRPHRLRLQTPRVKSSHPQRLPLRGLPSATPLQPFPLSGPSPAAFPRVSLHRPSLDPFPSATALSGPSHRFPSTLCPQPRPLLGALPSALSHPHPTGSPLSPVTTAPGVSPHPPPLGALPSAMTHPRLSPQPRPPFRALLPSRPPRALPSRPP